MKKRDINTRLTRLENYRPKKDKKPLNIHWVTAGSTDGRVEPKPGETWLHWDQNDNITIRQYNSDGTFTEK